MIAAGGENSVQTILISAGIVSRWIDSFIFTLPTTFDKLRHYAIIPKREAISGSSVGSLFYP